MKKVEENKQTNKKQEKKNKSELNKNLGKIFSSFHISFDLSLFREAYSKLLNEELQTLCLGKQVEINVLIWHEFPNQNDA